MYAFPPFSLIHRCLQKVIEDRAQVSPCGSSMEVQTMVSNIIGPSDRSAMFTTNGPPLSSFSLGESAASSSQSPQLQVSRVASIRQSLLSQNISERVSKILLASRKERTEKQYESAWKQFCRWCHKKSVNLFSCHLDSILLYLSDLYEKGLQYRTIDSNRSAISMTHLPTDNVCVRAHPLVSRLMKGIFNICPAVPKYLKTWDVSVVLKYLISLSPAPFLSLKKLTLKLVMIIAIIKAFRADLLHKLDLQYRVYKKDGVLFRVPQVTKTGKPSKPTIEVFFPAFPQDRRLCVVNYLKNYKRKTAKYCSISGETRTPLFISFIKPDAPVSSTTISRWLKSGLALAGTDTALFQGHSVCSAAASTAKKLGVSSAKIMKVADWSRESMFLKFYYKPTKDTFLEGLFYHQSNPAVICVLRRLAAWCPVLHEAEFRTVQRLGTNMQYSTNSTICRMGTSPPTPTQFIIAIL